MPMRLTKLFDQNLLCFVVVKIIDIPDFEILPNCSFRHECVGNREKGDKKKVEKSTDATFANG